MRAPPAAFAATTLALFGYHALYFFALKHAPPVEASLVNYLWPLLIVLFSALLPGMRLRAGSVAGALVFPHLSYRTLYIPAALTGTVGVAYVAYRLRRGPAGTLSP